MKVEFMETDKPLNQVFTVAPIELYKLLRLPCPRDARAQSVSFKDVETITDFVVEPLPGSESEPIMIVEFQGYRDKQFVPKAMLRCALFRTQNPNQAIHCHLIYFDRQFESTPIDDGGMFQPHIHYLPELLEELKNSDPNSPLLSVLHPLVAESEEELTASVIDDYENIRTTNELSTEQRAAWLNVFQVSLMKRFKKSFQEIQTMVIAQLPDVEELPWGQELKARWTSEGRSEGRYEALEAQLVSLREEFAEFESMRDLGQITDAAYARLTSTTERKMARLETELQDLKKRMK